MRTSARRGPAGGLRHAAVVLAAAGALVVALAGCGPSTSPVGRFGVGARIETFVEPASSSPSGETRTLTTTVLYPAHTAPGAVAALGAAPDREGAPYPLIAFSHGFGSSPSQYATLLQDWASAGYVVAAPLFPLTGRGAPGRADLADYVHQPADVSFVISQVLGESAARAGPLAGLVDHRRVGAAGHSLGGVTTLGLVANTCCRDTRVRAAVVMAGDPLTFPSGSPDYRAAPPILLVHGAGDVTVPYASSIRVFNDAPAPKGLLTIDPGNHGSPVQPDPGFDNVVRATTDFYDLYLKGDRGALDRLRADATSPVTKLVFVAGRGEHVTLPTPTTAPGHLRATVSPNGNLTDGATVLVSWVGYRPGVPLNVLQCSKSPPTGATDCDLHTAALSVRDPQGSGTLLFVVHTGAVGAGVCDAAHPRCAVVVNEGGSSVPSASVVVPVTFAS